MDWLDGWETRTLAWPVSREKHKSEWVGFRDWKLSAFNFSFLLFFSKKPQYSLEKTTHTPLFFSLCLKDNI